MGNAGGLWCATRKVKSWVPHSYLHQPEAPEQSEAAIVSPSGDGRYELLKMDRKLSWGNHDEREGKSVTSIPSASRPSEDEPPKLKSIELDARVNEVFSAWAADGSKVASSAHEHEQLDRMSLLPQEHGICAQKGHGHLPPSMGFVYPSDIRSIEDTVTALERTMQMIVGQQRQSSDRLATRIDQLKELTNINLIVDLEQELFREREEREKEAYAWSLEKKQLEFAVLELKSGKESDEEDWRSSEERRELMQELQSERERAAKFEDRLLAEKSAMTSQQDVKTALHRQQLKDQQSALDQLQAALGDGLHGPDNIRRQQVNALSLQLSAAQKDKSALAKKLQEVQELLAERDFALASMAQSSLARLTADDEEMNAVLMDMHNLGAALKGSFPAHAHGPQSPREGLELDQANAKIELMKKSVVMLLEHKSKLEAAVATRHEKNSDLLNELGKSSRKSSPSRNGFTALKLKRIISRWKILRCDNTSKI